MKKLLFSFCFSIFGLFTTLEVLSTEKYTPYKDSEKIEIRDLVDLINKENNKTPEEILDDPYMRKYINDFLGWLKYIKDLDVPDKSSDRTPEDLIKVFPDIPTKAGLELIPCLIRNNENKPFELIESSNKSLSISPNWFAYQCRGLGKYISGEYVSAIKDFNRSLEMMPKYYLNMAAETMNYMSLSKYELKEYKDAIADINGSIAISAIIKQPKGRYFHNRGLFLYAASDQEPNSKKARQKQASKDFSKAIRLRSTVLPNSYYLRALVDYELGVKTDDLICDDISKAAELGLKSDIFNDICK